MYEKIFIVFIKIVSTLKYHTAMGCNVLGFMFGWCLHWHKSYACSLFWLFEFDHKWKTTTLLYERTKKIYNKNNFVVEEINDKKKKINKINKYNKKLR